MSRIIISKKPLHSCFLIKKKEKAFANVYTASSVNVD